MINLPSTEQDIYKYQTIDGHYSWMPFMKSIFRTMENDCEFHVILGSHSVKFKSDNGSDSPGPNSELFLNFCLFCFPVIWKILKFSE